VLRFCVKCLSVIPEFSCLDPFRNTKENKSGTFTLRVVPSYHSRQNLPEIMELLSFWTGPEIESLWRVFPFAGFLTGRILVSYCVPVFFDFSRFLRRLKISLIFIFFWLAATRHFLSSLRLLEHCLKAVYTSLAFFWE